MSHLFADVLGRVSSVEFALRLLCAVSAVWLAAALGAIVLRRFSASLRHRIWSLSIATTLILPALVMVLPERRVGAIRLPAVPGVVAQSQDAWAIYAPSKIMEITPRSDGEVTQELTSDGNVPAGYPPHEAISREGPVRASARASGTASSTVEAPSAPGLSWQIAIGVLWIVPMIWLVIRQIVSIYSARRLLCQANQISSGRAITCIAHLSSRLRLRGQPPLLTSNLLTPICLGWWRPSILLPRDWETWSDAQLEAVLTHELAHIARRDVFWQTLARLACAVYWPHPIAWIAAWRMRVERELACDDWVLNAGESSERYARWLLDVAIALKGKPHAAELVGVAMASRSGFEKRVSAILDEQRPRRPISRPLAIALSIIAIVLLGIAGTFSPLAPEKVSAQQAAQSPAKSTTTPTTQPASNAGDIVHVSGRVEDDKGQPLIDTTITAQFGGKEYLAHPARDGSFAIDVESRFPNQGSISASNPDGSRQAFLGLSDTKLTGAEISNLHLTLRPAREFAVSVNDAKGAPVESALVVASASFAVAGQAKTDASGKATLRMAIDAPLEFVLAMKPDVGLDYFLFWRKDMLHTNPYQLEPDFAGPLKFELNGAVAVKVRVVDEQNRPMVGVNVSPWMFEKPGKGNFANVSGVWLSQFKQVTDQAGIAEYRFVPADQSKAVTFWTSIPGYSSPDRWNYDPKSGTTEVVAKLLRQVHIAGRVAGPDGVPAGGAKVQFVGADHNPLADFRQETQSSADGSFAMDVDQDKYYAIVAQKDKLASSVLHKTILKDAPPSFIELKLAPATRVFGQATAGPGNRPLHNASISFALRDSSYYQLPPREQLTGDKAGTSAIQPSPVWCINADLQGNFEAYVVPGKYIADLNAGAINISEELQVAGAQQQVNLHSEQATALIGRVVLADQPQTGVAGASIKASGLDLDADVDEVFSDSQGNFTVQRGKDDLYLFATSPDRSLIGLTIVKSTDKTATLAIGKAGTARGRLVDSGGQPLAGQQIDYGIGIHTPENAPQLAFSRSTKTDAAGKFALDTLVPGYEYELNIVASFGDDGQANSWRQIGTTKVLGSGTADLGDFKGAPAPPKMWKVYEAAAFDKKGSFAERLDEATITARLSYQNVMVLLGSPEKAPSQQFFENRHEPNGDQRVWTALMEHVLVAVNTQTAQSQTREWAQQTKVGWPTSGMTLAVLDIDGHLVGQTTDADLSTNGKLDPVKLIQFARKCALVLPDAEKLLADALAQARRENKMVLIAESMPYRSGCVLLSKYIEANQKLIDKGFVYVKLDRRFDHGQEILERLRAKDWSTPWMAVLSPDGKIMTTSGADGENFEYPESAEGKRQWEQMLRTAAPRLTDADIKQLIAAIGTK